MFKMLIYCELKSQDVPQGSVLLLARVTTKPHFGLGLGLEDVDGPHNVLAADGALAHPLPALGAGDHVAALQQDAVDDGVHADPTQVVVVIVQLHLLTL